MDKRKFRNSNLLFVLLAVVVIIIYLLFDGYNMFKHSFDYMRGSNVYDNVASTDYREEVNGSDIIKDMLEQHYARAINLIISLFPIVFITLRFHVSFSPKTSFGLKKWMPYIRLIFGFIFFYYVMTIKTVFSHELFTNYYSFGHWVSFFRIIGAFAILGCCIIDWPNLISAVRSFPSFHPKLYKVVFILFIALWSCMILEFQVGSRMNMASSLLLYNILYWIILQVFVDVITRNVKIGSFVSLGLSYLIGLINDIVFQFRGNYVMFGDLTVVRTAMEVAGNYTYKPSFWFWLSLGLLLSAVVITIILKFPKRSKYGVREVLLRSGIAASIVVCVILTFTNGMLYKNIMGVAWNYNESVAHTGYIPYFLSNMNSIAKVELEGYDAQLAADALDKAPEYVNNTYASPNIIIIQNEAFSDLSVLYDIETNQDYLPYIHSLTENTQKGYLNMSITGGPTANSEFEVLTRSTLQFLPYGAVPYTQYINADIPSVPQVLESQPTPYHTVAYHPYYSSGYSRTNVYTHFGFDEIVFENNFRGDFPESELPREYLSDSSDYKRVEQMYEDFRSSSDEPWFCFNVTIQNHGGYTQVFEPTEENMIYVTNFQATESINSYLSLIKTSDEAFKELIEYFSQCDEPTIIAMYGDHQPSLDNDALEVLATHAGDQVNNYYVPYVIWANFDIEEVNTLGDAEHEPVLNTLSTNYFASTVLEIAGVELSDYDRYLLDLHESVPAITAIGIWDSEGNYYPSIDACPYSDELSALQMVQYNLIFDDDGRLTDRFV
ncbi:Phosphoglycerol transferase MdoB [Ruminococcaceae bacterium KH2T8]|nr:Phosphoglycerol transferase MdoB [Ruminococcaceae bacterium KH2T8]